MHAGRYVGDTSTALPHALSGPGEVVFVNVTKEEFVTSSGLLQVCGSTIFFYLYLGLIP